jgi:hypothetical protein
MKVTATEESSRQPFPRLAKNRPVTADTPSIENLAGRLQLRPRLSIQAPCEHCPVSS